MSIPENEITVLSNDIGIDKLSSANERTHLLDKRHTQTLHN